MEAVVQLFPLKQGFSVAYLVVDGADAMLVDTALPGLERQLLPELQRLGATLRLIVLTHFHYDHVGSADAIRAETGAPVAIHHRDADALRRGGRLHLRPTALLSTMGPISRLLAPNINRMHQKSVFPDIELADDEDLAHHGGFGRALATPGHTAGSVSVLLPDDTVLAGDALTRAPFLHSAAGPMFVEDAAATSSSIARVAAVARSLRVGHFGTEPMRAGSLRRLARRQQR